MRLKKLVAGNWKMHGLSSDLPEIGAIAAGARAFSNVDAALCVPATLVERAAREVPGFAIGGQDVHYSDKGAYTGSTSATMLRDAGATLTIVGHSERRAAYHEKNDEVRAKAEAALGEGLETILCVGESLAEREGDNAIATVERQLGESLPRSIPAAGALAVAYEPIWAIGTGRIPSLDDIGAMHAALRARLAEAYGDAGGQVRILYGGSVNGSNAADIFKVAHVDGALVGGASLKAADFLAIVEAAANC